MKKLVSIICVLSMCLSLTMPVLGANVNTAGGSAQIFVVNENGLYQPIGNSAVQAIFNSSTISADLTEDPDIFRVNSNNYLVRSFDNNFVMTERYEINPTSFDAEKYSDIPTDVLEQAKEEIDRQLERGNDNFTIEIYAPSSGIERNGWGGEYTYGPYQLKDYFIDLKYGRTDWVTKDGKDALEWADDLVNVVLSVAGIKSKKVSIYSAGMSALDFIVEQTGIKVTQTSTDDCIQTDTIYNKTGKSTYVLTNGNWLFSLQTAKVTITQINTYAFFHETGETPYSSAEKSDTMTTENWDNPQMAITMQGVGYTDSPIIHTVWDEKFVF